MPPLARFLEPYWDLTYLCGELFSSKYQLLIKLACIRVNVSVCDCVCIYVPEAGLISTGFTRLLQVPRFMNLCIHGIVTDGLVSDMSHALSNRMPCVSSVSSVL